MPKILPYGVLSDEQMAIRNDDDTSDNSDHGQVAEEVVADAWELLEHAADEAFWYDVRADLGSRSTKGEVKSCQLRVGVDDDYPADGRFRIRRDQHRSLVASDAQATAWYFFVVFDNARERIIIQRRRPTTVTRLVDERGGWNESGHSEFDEEYKMPIEAVVDIDA